MEAIMIELTPLGVRVGPKGVFIHHKTTGNLGKLNLIPLSGGVFQLSIELSSPSNCFI